MWEEGGYDPGGWCSSSSSSEGGESGSEEQEEEEGGGGKGGAAALTSGVAAVDGGGGTGGTAAARGALPSRLWGLDCEMCLTEAGLELTRITLVDEGGGVVMDEYVRPDRPIEEYRTEVRQ